MYNILAGAQPLAQITALLAAALAMGTSTKPLIHMIVSASTRPLSWAITPVMPTRAITSPGSSSRIIHLEAQFRKTGLCCCNLSIHRRLQPQGYSASLNVKSSCHFVDTKLSEIFASMRHGFALITQRSLLSVQTLLDQVH